MKKEFDPRMHSAEHILNQTMVRMFNCGRCFSAHIEKKKSKCDYHFDRVLTKEEVQKIEICVNEVIQADMPVNETYITKEDAKKYYNIQRLPKDVGNRIRIISIGDYDTCPCIGPHICLTNEIGGFRIVSTSFENGVLRVRFKLHKSNINLKDNSL